MVKIEVGYGRERDSSRRREMHGKGRDKSRVRKNPVKMMTSSESMVRHNSI